MEGQEPKPGAKQGLKGLFQQFKNAWSEAQEKADEIIAEKGTAKAPERPPSPAPAAAKASTRPLPQRRASETGVLGEATNTQPLKTPEEEADESAQRLAFILDYMRNPGGNPAFQDKPLMYRILNEERDYQQRRVIDLQNQLRRLPPPPSAMGLSEAEVAGNPQYEGLDERRAELSQALGTARTRQGQIFTLMKRLTGKTGRTGGTDFLVEPTEPPRGRTEPLPEPPA